MPEALAEASIVAAIAKENVYKPIVRGVKIYHLWREMELSIIRLKNWKFVVEKVSNFRY